jgi:hypothetical protein
MRRALELADYLDNHARSPEDNEAARTLRNLAVMYMVAREIVTAKTHEQSRAAYAELVTHFKGKND